MSLSLFSINARGIHDLLKRKALFLYCKGKSVDFCLIQDKHACSSDAVFWKNQWGKEIWLSFGSNCSAGVAILQDKFTGQILNYEKDDCDRWILLVLDKDNEQFVIVNCYATNNKVNKDILFKNIESRIQHLISLYPSAKVIWGGDFNTVV